MNYIKTAFLAAILIIAGSFGPSFVSALEMQDNGATAGESNTPPVQDNGTTAGEANTPPVQDNGTTAGSPSTPPIQDNGTTAGTSNTPAVQDNGTTAGADTSSGNTGGPSGSSGRSRNTIGTATVIQISNIQITPSGAALPTVTLAIDRTYIASWQSSIRNVNTTIELVSVSTGKKVLLGVSSNPSSVNTFSFTTPTIAIGDYTLRFTDNANRTTIAPNIYTVVNKPAAVNTPAKAGENTKTAGTPSIKTSAEDGIGESETAPLTTLEEIIPEEESNQAASVLSAIGDFLNKYLLRFFILVLLIAGALLVWERRNAVPKL